MTRDTFSEAQKLIEHIFAKGFMFRTFEDYHKKALEELAEVQEAHQSGDGAHLEEELGDAMLALCQLTVMAKLNPETVLSKALDKFKGRFKLFETMMLPETNYHTYSDAELLKVWKRAKAGVKAQN